jgi:hypothetical protein
MSARAAQIKVRYRELDLLAEDIRRHHKAVERHARAMLDEAIVAGLKLIEAKERLRHGEFGPFVAYCGISRRSAQVYMTLARNRRSAALLEADSIREALDALGGKRKKRGGPPPDFGEPGVKFAACRGQTNAWLEAMAAEGRHELFTYYVPDGKWGVRLCWTTVSAAAYNRKRWKAAAS